MKSLFILFTLMGVKYESGRHGNNGMVNAMRVWLNDPPIFSDDEDLGQTLDNSHTIGEMDSSDILAYSGEISGTSQELSEQEKVVQN
jgi:hypothetical protein